MAHENEVVYGDNGLDACLLDACRQFAREAVVELYAVADEVFHDAAHVPQCLRQAAVVSAVVDVACALAFGYLPPQRVVAAVGGV